MSAEPGFMVRLDNFEGPFDLLLQLIAKHKLDLTEVALSRVTDEFIDHVKTLGKDWDLDLTSNFLLVAATLLDLKAARLIPSGQVEDPEDLALLEARDLLFARLLQYRAFKEISGWLGQNLLDQARRAPRPGGLEDRFAGLLPEVDLRIGPDELAKIAARALTPKEAVEVSLTHLHASQVSVVAQARLVVDRLRGAGRLTFGDLIDDAPDRITVVCRFLALLELFRERAVNFTQTDALGVLEIEWTGADDRDLDISDEFDTAVVDPVDADTAVVDPADADTAVVDPADADTAADDPADADSGRIDSTGKEADGE